MKNSKSEKRRENSNMIFTFFKSNKKTLFIYTIGIYLLFSFEDKLILLFDNYIIEYLDFKTTNVTLYLFVLILVFLIMNIIKSAIDRFEISFNRYLFYTISFVIYVYYRINNFKSLEYQFLPEDKPVSYLDTLFILLFIFLIITFISFLVNRIKAKKKISDSKITDSKLGFISDEPIKNIEDDILDYATDAANLAKNLEDISINSPCSIGVISNWGKGKSTYLNFVENGINRDKFIIVKFNPRHSKSAINIQEDFFNLLYSNLKVFNSEFSSLFKDYMKAIGIIGRNNFFSIVLNIYKIWNKDNEKTRLSKAIFNLPKRVIVFIEDFDRLLSEEIIEVFKLIDGNASINNIIFITAYDKVHINKVIGESLKNENTYFSDKFFTWEVQIPLRPYIKTYKYFEEKMLDCMHLKVEELDIYKTTLNAHYKLIETYLPTLRDVKRFINMFARQYQFIETEVELNDYLLVSLIKYRYPDEYQRLFQKEYINTNILTGSGKFYTLNDKLDTSINSISILKELFSDKAKSYRGINNINAFEIYFLNTVYGSLTIKQMSSLMVLDENDAISKLEEWEDDNKLNDVFDFLDSKNITAFNGKEEFNRYLLILFYLSLSQYHTIVYILIIRLLYTSNRDEICKTYNFTEDEYKSLIIKQLMGNNGRFPFQITKKIILNIFNNEFIDSIIFDHNEVLKISKYYLDEKLKSKEEEFESFHMELLYCCISDIDKNTRHITLDKDACLKIKELIITKPSYYINSFVRLGMFTSDPNFNTVACEPFWKQIFGDVANFEQFIYSNSLDNLDKINLVRNFWEIYRNNEFNQIEFTNEGNVQEKINNELKTEIDNLNTLKGIQLKLDEIRKNLKIKNKVKIKKCEQLLENLDKVKLYIRFTGSLRTDIETYKQSLII